MAKQPFDLDRFTPEQIDAARMLCDPETKNTVAKVAAELGVTERTIYRWKLDEEFLTLMDHVAERYMDAFTSEIYRHLVKSVKSGSVKAMELGLKTRGKLVERREVVSDVNVEVTLTGKTNEQILAEIREMERRALTSAVIEIEGAVVGGDDD